MVPMKESSPHILHYQIILLHLRKEETEKEKEISGTQHV